MNAEAVDVESIQAVHIRADKPFALNNKAFAQNRWPYYAFLREHLPVHPAKIVGMSLYVTARYEDCLTVVKDPRFVRNRSTVTGGRRFPFPLPKNLAFLAEGMITQDDPEHRRLRSLVQKAFSPKSIARLETQLEAFAHTLIDQAIEKGTFNAQQDYALPIPTRVIADMVGIDDEQMEQFRQGLRILSSGFTGLAILRTVTWDLHRLVRFVRELVAEKRSNPGDDILTELIEAEEDGERLSEDELVSMVFLLVIAGFETTVHLISNGLLALLRHGGEMQKLRERPELVGSAVEEMLRYCGPVHGTKMNFATEDIELRGVVIPKASMVMPLLGSANRDERMFPDADVFDIQRDPNRHLAFSQGNHFCLGAFLARMETRVAFKVLLERSDELTLAIPEHELEVLNVVGWYRHADYPVHIR